MIRTLYRIGDILQSRTCFLLLLGAVGGQAVWLVAFPESNDAVASGLVLLSLVQLFVTGLFWAQARSADARFERSWQMLTAAIFLWFAAGLVLAFSWFSQQLIPAAPSLWHWLRFAGYLAFLLGVAVFPLSPVEKYSRLRIVFDVLTLVLATSALCWAIFIRPVLALQLFRPIPFLWESSGNLLDLVLIVLLFRTFAVNGSPEYPNKTFLAFSAAFVFRFAGNISIIVSLLDGQLNMSFLTSVWIATFFLFLYGMRHIRSGKRDREQIPITERMRRRVEFWLPIILSYLATGYILVHWYLTRRPDWIGLGFLLAFSITLVARQGVIAGQYEVRQFETLVNTVSSPAFICLPNGKLRLWNPAMTELVLSLGASGSEIRLTEMFSIGLSMQELFAVVEAGGWSGIAVLKGQERSYSLSLQPIRDENRRAALLAGSAYDLSDILQREQALQQALADVGNARSELQVLNTALEHKVEIRTRELQDSVRKLAELNTELKALDRLKSEFVTLVSHELRAPLTTMETGLELAVREVRTGRGDPAETLALVQQETRRLELFIETILDISALDAGRVHFECAPVDMHTAVKEVLEELGTSNLASRLQLDVPASLPAVLAAGSALHSVLHHLLDNVVKYAPEGEVILHAEALDGGVQVRIQDQGPGIPAAERERVFELFHRLDSRDAREVYGYGLGLSIARRFLEAMEGWIRLEEVPEGTSVLFWLPVVPEISVADRV